MGWKTEVGSASAGRCISTSWLLSGVEAQYPRSRRIKNEKQTQNQSREAIPLGEAGRGID
ncbi:MAG: hypothetical protein CR965_02470 [Paludibacter sp.]|nr:MAG: hypothetical protein CR965_02470 [Paludibacter sp.]